MFKVVHVIVKRETKTSLRRNSERESRKSFYSFNGFELRCLRSKVDENVTTNRLDTF